MDDQDRDSALLITRARRRVQVSLIPLWLFIDEDSDSCSTLDHSKMPQATYSHVMVTVSNCIREHCGHKDLTASCGSLIQRVQDLYHHALVDCPPGRTFLKLLQYFLVFFFLL